MIPKYISLSSHSLLKSIKPYQRLSSSYHHFHRFSSARHSQIDYDPYISTDKSNAISWYPGHIAKAERELTDYLQKVDVVVEVRDARIPLATTHPKALEWIGKKPVIVVLLRIDQISSLALTAWKQYYKTNLPHIQLDNQKHTQHEYQPAKVFFINGKLGTNVPSLKKEILKAGKSVNERRVRKGIAPRAVRAAIIGYPNVGKSALINRLLGRNMAKSRNLPGVTKALTWVRLGAANVASASGTSIDQSTNPQGEVIELLDSPGIIPAKQLSQETAIKLAICNDIGEASYDRVIVATEMCNYLNRLHHVTRKVVDMHQIENRYKIPFSKMTGDEIVYHIAETSCQGNTLSAADKLLSDFRKNFLSYGSLEYPVGIVISSAMNKKRSSSPSSLPSADHHHDDDKMIVDELVSMKKEKKKINTAKVMVEDDHDNSDEDIISLDIGRGSYDGW